MSDLEKKTNCKVYSLLDLREIRIKRREIESNKQLQDSLDRIEAKLEILENNIFPPNNENL